MRVIAMIAALSATAAHAGPYEDARNEAYAQASVIAEQRDGSTCAIIGFQARTIMAIRLDGMSMSDQMGPSPDPFIFYLIRDAYSRPFYRTPDLRQQLLRDFREKYESECYGLLGIEG
jgi:hypothetical protein